MVILYSTSCPRCKVLQQKLESKGIEYKKETDIKTMGELGFTTVPMLQVDNKETLDFNEAIKWVNEYAN